MGDGEIGWMSDFKKREKKHVRVFLCLIISAQEL